MGKDYGDGIDFDQPADIEHEESEHRDPKTGEPLPAEAPEDEDGEA